MHHVDFNDPLRTRTPKDSAKYYARLIANNGFVPEEYCDSPTTYSSASKPAPAKSLNSIGH